MWFYTYYMRADDNRNVIVSDDDSKVIEDHDGIEFQLYPIYSTAIEYSQLMDLNDPLAIVNRYLEQDYEDFSSDSFDDIESIESDNE